MPPFLPDIEAIPIALVVSVHFFGDIVNLFNPASFDNSSNSMSLKSGLFNLSQIDTDSNVFFCRNQLAIKPMSITLKRWLFLRFLLSLAR